MPLQKQNAYAKTTKLICYSDAFPLPPFNNFINLEAFQVDKTEVKSTASRLLKTSGSYNHFEFLPISFPFNLDASFNRIKTSVINAAEP